MTSGDESDNEDLTDASSESDWFEFASGCSRHLRDISYLMPETKAHQTVE
jgi:hypothetical protein